MEDGSADPSGTDDTISCGYGFDEIVVGFWGSSPICVYVSDEVGQRGQFEAFNEGAAFAYPAGEFESGNGLEIVGHPADYLDSVVDAAIQDHHQLELAAIIVVKILSVVPENGLDPKFLVISGNEQEQARFWCGQIGRA